VVATFQIGLLSAPPGGDQQQPLDHHYGEAAMRKLSVSRRRFLASVGGGGVAVALGAESGKGAAAPLPQPAGPVSPELLVQIAQYASFPLPPDRASQLTPLLSGALATLRQLRPDGYDNLAPAGIFRVPSEA
jgi:hypothetical protein